MRVWSTTAKIACTASLILAVLLATSGAGERPVLTVGREGAQYTTIQAAIDAAPPGAVLRIGPGEYEGGVKIDKPLTLRGEGWQQTTILAPRLSPQEIDKAGRVAMQQAAQAETEGQSNAIKQAFRDQYLRPAILIVNTGGVEIRELKVTCQGLPMQARIHPEAHVLLRGAEAKIVACAILGSSGSGVILADGSEADLRESLLAGLWWTAIEIGVRGDPSRCQATVADCDIRNCYYAGIMIRKGQEALVERCRISGAAWHGIRYDDSNPRIVGNRIAANHRSGIYASGKTAATVQQNLFLTNGMSCWFENRDTIVENTFAESNDGLWVLGDSQPAVERNLFFKHNEGIVCGSIDAPGPAAKSVGDPDLKSNVFWKVESPIVRRKAGQPPTEKSEQRELADTQGQVLDPQIVNPDAQDFTLSSDSPLRHDRIGAADPLPMESRWPLQPEELAIIPDGPTRDDQQWKLTIESQQKSAEGP